MKSFFASALLLFAFFAQETAQANSNITGTWIDNGQTLSITIVDDPARAPFTAGELWQSIKADRLDAKGNRFVQTGNFELVCSAAAGASGQPYGNCRMRVARNRVFEQPLEFNFMINKDEARAALENFAAGSGSVLIKSGMTDSAGKSLFLFEENWQFGMVAGGIRKSLVTP